MGDLRRGRTDMMIDFEREVQVALADAGGTLGPADLVIAVMRPQAGVAVTAEDDIAVRDAVWRLIDRGLVYIDEENRFSLVRSGEPPALITIEDDL